jgi:hypothetical protein
MGGCGTSKIKTGHRNKYHATVQKLAKKLKPQHLVPFEDQNASIDLFSWQLSMRKPLILQWGSRI